MCDVHYIFLWWWEHGTNLECKFSMGHYVNDLYCGSLSSATSLNSVMYCPSLWKSQYNKTKQIFHLNSHTRIAVQLGAKFPPPEEHNWCHTSPFRTFQSYSQTSSERHSIDIKRYQFQSWYMWGQSLTIPHPGVKKRLCDLVVYFVNNCESSTLSHILFISSMIS